MGQITVERDVNGIKGLCVITPAVHGEKSATFVVASINTDGIAKHNRGGVRRIVSLKNRIFCQGNGA